MTRPGDGPTPLEQRGSALGITFTRGRTRTSSSLLAHEAADFLADHPARDSFHKGIFKAYFTDLADIGAIDTIVDVAAGVGIDPGPLREALENRTRKESVEESLALAREIGITGVPTFIIDEQHAIVGAQEGAVFRDILQRLGKGRRQP